MHWIALNLIALNFVKLNIHQISDKHLDKPKMSFLWKILEKHKKAVKK